jgi:hypothetical protein
MNRRAFLHQSAWIGAGAALLPLWLSGCKKTDLYDQPLFQGEVVIVPVQDTCHCAVGQPGEHM